MNIETEFFNDKYDFIETARKVLASNDGIEYDDDDRTYYDRLGHKITDDDHLEQGEPFKLNNTLYLFQEAVL